MEPEKIKSFTDAAGRVWHPRITVATLCDFEEQTGIAMLTAGSNFHQGKLSVLIRLAFLACEKEVAEHELAFKDFAAALTDQEMTKRACDAIGTALADFFQSQTQTPEKVASPGAGGASTK